MTVATFRIPAISCNHCVHTIQSELSELAGVSRVEASLADKQVTVEYGSPATEEQIVARLADINYPPAR